MVKSQEKFSTFSGKFYDFFKDNLPIYTGKFNGFYKKMWKFFLEKSACLYINIWRFIFSLMFNWIGKWKIEFSTKKSQK